MDYEDETDISFDEDTELYAYLWRLYNYLFENGRFLIGHEATTLICNGSQVFLDKGLGCARRACA